MLFVFWVLVFWTEHYDIGFFIGCVWAIYLMSLFNIQMSEPEALKTIEEKDVNESGISNSLQRSVYENQNNVVFIE